ncbi:Adenylylsulfatase HINT1 [Bienertia sinuspersici]
MSAILTPVKLCQNPIKTRLIPGFVGSQLTRVLPSLTRIASGSGPRLIRVSSHSTSSNPPMNSEKEAALNAASTPPDSPTMRQGTNRVLGSSLRCFCDG